MTTLLKYDARTITLGSTAYDALADFKTFLTTYNWQVVQQSVSITSYLGAMTNPSNAFDLSFSTSATSTAALPLQIGCQGSTALTITRCAITIGSNTTFAPKDFTIEYSDNGSSWTTALTVTNETLWNGYERKFYTWTSVGSHAYWRVNVSAKNGGATLEFLDLMFEDASGQMYAGLATLSVIPPNTETIGDSHSRECVRFEINNLGTLLTIHPVMQLLTDNPAMFLLYEKTAGAVACACTINGATVTGATGSAGSTAAQNLRALYEAIRESADSNFTAFDWYWAPAPPQNANDATAHIYAVQKTPAPQPSFSVNANTNGYLVGVYAKASVQGVNGYRVIAAHQLGIDLANGFICYWQLNSRSLALGIKTNVAYNGVIHACYADHTKAVASMPSGMGVHVTPIELVLGLDASSSNTHSSAGFSHMWGIHSVRQSSSALSSYWPAVVSGFGGHPFTNGGWRDRFMDASFTTDLYASAVSFNISSTGLTLLGSSVWASTDPIGNDFQIHRMQAIAPLTISPTTNWSGAQSTFYAPPLDIQDWYKFVGTASNEALIVVSDNVQYSTITSNLDATTLYTTLSVADGTKFSSGGGEVIIDDEIFSYTGVSSNTLTGVTRAVYGSVKAKHYSGDRCSQGMWFTVINGGALFAGYVKPT